MTETQRGLLQAIYDDPDDDAVRLVYADFLEENGEAHRAEFIRLQIDRANQQKEPPPSHRENALLRQHFDDWTREARPFDPDRMSLQFRRGFVESARIDGGTDEDLAVVRRLPELQVVELLSCDVSPAGLGHVAAHGRLRRVYLESTELDESCLAALEQVPCSTLVRASECGPAAEGDAWRDFQERRFRGFEELDPAQRRRAALSLLSHFSGASRGRLIKSVGFYEEPIDDAEMRVLREVPELEEVHLQEAAGITDAGFRHLWGLPNLKYVTLTRAPVSSLSPLTASPLLEKLEFNPSFGVDFTDEGTLGLERLTNLQKLDLRSCTDGLTDATIARLRPLTRLRELTLQIGPITDESCFEVLAGLTELESLAINPHAGAFRGAGFHEDLLRHLAGLRRLRVLKLHLTRGSGEQMRRLAGLRELRFLQLSGAAVTDAGLRHLAPLRGLCTLVAQHSAVTHSGAQALADRLPAVTILTQDHVVKSPRAAVTFRRHLVEGRASVLAPEHWFIYHPRPDQLGVHEDGWGGIGGWSGLAVGPAQFTFTVRPWQFQATVEGVQGRWTGNNPHLNPRVVGRGVVTWPGNAASCVYENDHSRHLNCVTIHRGCEVVLDCQAPVARFESFLPLFLFVARSVRLGDAAAEGYELVEVPMSEIERAAR